LLLNWLDDPKEKNKIVKVFCMQAIIDLAKDDNNLEHIMILKL